MFLFRLQSWPILILLLLSLLLSAIDWFLDRCITALNVTGDTVVYCIIAHTVPLADTENLYNDETKGTERCEADSSGEIDKEDVSNV